MKLRVFSVLNFLSQFELKQLFCQERSTKRKSLECHLEFIAERTTRNMVKLTMLMFKVSR